MGRTYPRCIHHQGGGWVTGVAVSIVYVCMCVVGLFVPHTHRANPFDENFPFDPYHHLQPACIAAPHNTYMQRGTHLYAVVGFDHHFLRARGMSEIKMAAAATPGPTAPLRPPFASATNRTRAFYINYLRRARGRETNRNWSGLCPSGGGGGGGKGMDTYWHTGHAPPLTHECRACTARIYYRGAAKNATHSAQRTEMQKLMVDLMSGEPHIKPPPPPCIGAFACYGLWYGNLLLGTKESWEFVCFWGEFFKFFFSKLFLLLFWIKIWIYGISNWKFVESYTPF